MFNKITALQIGNACSLEIYVLSLENALILLLTFEDRVLTCLLNFNLLSTSIPSNLT